MWLTALVMGVSGSLHCAGMCSPLALAVTTLRKPFLMNRLVYNGGRILCYGLLGALVSTFGSMFRLSGFQNALTITLGTVLIVLGLGGVSRLRIPIVTGIIQKITFSIKNLFSGFLQKKTVLSIGMMGVLNGLLPCGLTYLALTYCLTLPDIAAGISFMLIFGAGTLPMMLGLPAILQLLVTRLNFKLRSLTTFAMISLGILLITRSMYVHYHGNASPKSIASEIICQ